jgi:hypothetical protein
MSFLCWRGQMFEVLSEWLTYDTRAYIQRLVAGGHEDAIIGRALTD